MQPLAQLLQEQVEQTEQLLKLTLANLDLLLKMPFHHLQFKPVKLCLLQLQLDVHKVLLQELEIPSPVPNAEPMDMLLEHPVELLLLVQLVLL